MKDKTVYIIDSFGLIFRAYYALFNNPLTNKNNENISALVIFFKNLKALLAKDKPAYLAAAFDSRTKTFRHQLYSEYKANRMKTPEDLLAQIPWIEEVLNALNVPVLRADGYEADDVIASVAKKCSDEGFDCRILSGDKDLLQLVSPTCKEMTPDRQNGGWEVNGIEEVKEKWGIGPEKILDYLSLVGDTADNVPGVKGVGEKTALKLLNEYQSLDGIYEHADEIKGALGNKIREDRENAFFSRKLITLVYDVPLEINFDDFKTESLDYEKAGKILESYGAKQVAKSYLQEAAKKENPEELKKSEDTENDGINRLEEEKTEGKEIKQNKGNYKACTELSELKEFIDSALKSSFKALALDTETTSLDTRTAELVGFSLSNKKGEGIYVPLLLNEGIFAQTLISKKDSLSLLSVIFSSEDFTIVMHNGKFDLEVLRTNGLESPVKCRIFDTMVAAWLCDSSAGGKSPYSLEYLGEKILGLKGIEFNDIVPKGHTFADVPLEKAREYGAEDADFTWQLYLYYKDLIKKQNLESLFYDMEMKILPILTEMEENGIHLDKKALSDFSIELSEKIQEKENLIYTLSGHDFNIASTKQLQTVLFEERGLIPGKKTKTGYSTDTAVLEELAERTSDPLPQAILDYRSDTKLLSTYVEALPKLADKNGMIRTTFLQTGTATGRLSSREPNLQNIPVRSEEGRRIRAAFTALPGTVLISADYAQIELVVLAHLSKDENLCRAFIDGTDVHKSTASLIYGIKAEEVSPQQRRFAKTVNFGVMYGMSAFRLAKELEISRTEAKNFIETYFKTYEGVRKFLDKTIEDARKNEYVETIMGRRRNIPEINNRNKLVQQGAERIAVNTPIQGSAADIVKKAMIDVNEALKKTNSRAKMLLQVHDELIFSCPDDKKTIEETVSLIKEKMENAVKLNIPLRVSIEYGTNWGQFH